MVLGVDFGRKKTGTAFMDMNIKIPFPLLLIEESNAKKVKACFDGHNRRKK